MSLTTEHEPASAQPTEVRRRITWTVLIAAAACALVLASVVALTGGAPARRTQARPSNVVQGPVFPTPEITDNRGRVQQCPVGSEPHVNMTGGTFTPPLRGGTSFGKGTYRIDVVGMLVNESTQAVTVTSAEPMIGGRPWSGATVRMPVQVAANSSAPLSLHGRYASRAAGRVSVSIRMTWRWTDPRWQACGERGLVVDD